MHCKSYSHFFGKKFRHICASLDLNFYESLTNDVVSFEQLSPYLSTESKQMLGTNKKKKQNINAFQLISILPCTRIIYSCKFKQNSAVSKGCSFKVSRYSLNCHFFHKGDNFCDFLFAFLYTKPLLIKREMIIPHHYNVTGR